MHAQSVTSYIIPTASLMHILEMRYKIKGSDACLSIIFLCRLFSVYFNGRNLII